MTTSGMFQSHGRQITASAGAANGFTSAASATSDRSAQGRPLKRKPQPEQHQRDHQRVDMAAIGDLPNRQRMPDIGDNAASAAVACASATTAITVTLTASQPSKASRIAVDVFAEAGDDQKEKFGNRRINRHGVVGAIDARKNRRVAQCRERIVRRENSDKD